MSLDAIVLYVGDEALLALNVSRGVGDATPTEITPTNQKIQVVDKKRVDVIAETVAGLTGNTIFYMIGSANVTASAGNYTVIWTVYYTVGGNDEVKKFIQILHVLAPY